MSDEPYKMWQCRTCGEVYDEAAGLPEAGIPAGTRFADLPDDWICPACGSGKKDFDPIDF